MTSVFNSPFEMSLRALLTLSEIKNTMTVDSIATADFITIYSKEFKLSKNNLHGENEFSFTEFALHRKQLSEALKSLILDRLILVHQTPFGFEYSLSEKGEEFSSKLNSEYANDYRKFAKKARQYMASKSEKELLGLIGKEAARSLKGENRE